GCVHHCHDQSPAVGGQRRRYVEWPGIAAGVDLWLIAADRILRRRYRRVSADGQRNLAEMPAIKLEDSSIGVDDRMRAVVGHPVRCHGEARHFDEIGMAEELVECPSDRQAALEVRLEVIGPLVEEYLHPSLVELREALPVLLPAVGHGCHALCRRLCPFQQRLLDVYA